MEFTINSINDKISIASVFGETLLEAIEEILHLNAHTYLSDTDWDIYNKDGDYLVVEDGLEI